MGRKKPQSKPWERLEKEGDGAFEAFMVYRDAGTSRSVKDTAEAVGKSYNTVRRYSSRFNWAERAAAWDGRKIEAQDKATLTAIEKMTAKHYKLTELGLGVAQATLAATLQGSVQSVKCPHCSGAVKVPKAKATVREAAALMRDGITLQRLVTDQATDRTESRIDVSKLPPGDAARLLELLAKAGYEG
jgi:hypothetical protein